MRLSGASHPCFPGSTKREVWVSWRWPAPSTVAWGQCWWFRLLMLRWHYISFGQRSRPGLWDHWSASSPVRHQHTQCSTCHLGKPLMWCETKPKIAALMLFSKNCRGRTCDGAKPKAQPPESRTRLQRGNGGEAERQHAAQEDQSWCAHIWNGWASCFTAGTTEHCWS